QSLLFRHQNSSTSTTALTPIPTLPHVNKKSSLPSTTQQFYHHLIQALVMYVNFDIEYHLLYVFYHLYLLVHQM
ncbi:unnamed protein product, partial [Rotaria sp. Silwood2]